MANEIETTFIKPGRLFSRGKKEVFSGIPSYEVVGQLLADGFTIVYFYDCDNRILFRGTVQELWAGLMKQGLLSNKGDLGES